MKKSCSKKKGECELSATVVFYILENEKNDMIVKDIIVSVKSCNRSGIFLIITEQKIISGNFFISKI